MPGRLKCSVCRGDRILLCDPHCFARFHRSILLGSSKTQIPPIFWHTSTCCSRSFQTDFSGSFTQFSVSRPTTTGWRRYLDCPNQTTGGERGGGGCRAGSRLTRVCSSGSIVFTSPCTGNCERHCSGHHPNHCDAVLRQTYAYAKNASRDELKSVFRFFDRSNRLATRGCHHFNSGICPIEYRGITLTPILLGHVRGPQRTHFYRGINPILFGVDAAVLVTFALSWSTKLCSTCGKRFIGKCCGGPWTKAVTPLPVDVISLVLQHAVACHARRWRGQSKVDPQVEAWQAFVDTARRLARKSVARRVSG